jgi:predicted ATPase
MLRGWALAMQGHTAESVMQIRHGLATQQSVGPKLYNPYFLSLLVEAYGQAGQPEAGLEVLGEALTLVNTTEARRWEARLYCLKGVLLLQLPRADVHQADACFQQALSVARS